MTTIAGDLPSYPSHSAKRDRVLVAASQAIGAAGAVGTLTADDPGVTVTKNAAAGTYDVVFPKAIAAKIVPVVKSAAGTVVGAYLTAYSASAGTAQVVTTAGDGTATNPANGDELHLLLWLDKRSDS